MVYSVKRLDCSPTIFPKLPEGVDLTFTTIHLNNNYMINNQDKNKLIFDNFVKWSNNVVSRGIMTQREYERKLIFLNCITEKSFKEQLLKCLDHVNNSEVNIVSSLEKLPFLTDYEELIDELFELNFLELLNTSESYRKHVVEELLLYRPYNQLDQLKEFIYERVNIFKLMLKSLNELTEKEDVINTIKKIDNHLLNDMNNEQQCHLAKKIIKSNLSYISFNNLTKYIDMYKNKIQPKNILIKEVITEEDLNLIM